MSSAKRQLSPRQAECLRRVRALQSTDEIARDLQISTGTVNGYIREAVVALGARDRRHAALIFESVESPDVEPVAIAHDASATVHGAHEAFQDLPSFHAIDLERPPSVVRDATAPAGAVELPLRRVVREIVNGSRPEGWSILTRSTLILGSVVVIGVAILVISASLGILYSLASAIRSATG
ncbi:helix-turn-helix transcriptional regulator [Sphingomonas sp. MMS24-J45]|uniref:helix-turn-helix domain-containing protein n=1 Tax=Sphingomonas sp. MMS24-J45 TaxID=3238806 RepID=UPI00385086A4